MAEMPYGTLEMDPSDGTKEDQEAAMKRQKKKLKTTWVKDTEETILQILRVLSQKVQANTAALQRLTGDYSGTGTPRTNLGPSVISGLESRGDEIKRSDRVSAV
jgi:hypothetical protein